jgi:uncharacterized protein (TIGR03067 family)
MRYAFLLSVFVISSARGAEVVQKTDSDRMQGVWLIEEVSINGVKMTVPIRLEAVIEKNTLTVRVDGATTSEKADFKLDSSAEIRTMDFVDGKGKTVGFAIYKLEGDKLTICMAKKKRPDKFASEKGSGAGVSVLKRQAK